MRIWFVIVHEDLVHVTLEFLTEILIIHEQVWLRDAEASETETQQQWKLYLNWAQNKLEHKRSYRTHLQCGWFQIRSVLFFCGVTGGVGGLPAESETGRFWRFPSKPAGQKPPAAPATVPPLLEEDLLTSAPRKAPHTKYWLFILKYRPGCNKN